MDFNRAKHTCYRTDFFLRQLRLTKWSFFIHSTMRTPDSNCAGLSGLTGTAVVVDCFIFSVNINSIVQIYCLTVEQVKLMMSTRI